MRRAIFLVMCSALLAVVMFWTALLPSHDSTAVTVVSTAPSTWSLATVVIGLFLIECLLAFRGAKLVTKALRNRLTSNS